MTIAPAPSLPAAITLDRATLDAVDGPLGIAVSGGGDSTALAILLADSCRDRGLVILTVDHRLRAGSADDAAAVIELGARLDLPTESLAIEGGAKGSLQAWARAERYRLLAEAARRLGLAAIVTGHTRDDQAETLLLRLARGSGLRGLGAMRPVARHSGTTILRPLLGVSREELRAFLLARGHGWREDPSNENPRFDRIAMRAIMPRLAALGLTSTRLAESASHLARASEVVDTLARRLCADVMRMDQAGALAIDRPAFAVAETEVRLRALADAIQRTGGLDHTPRFEALRRADAAIRAGGASLTLGRARILSEADIVRLWREDRGISPVALGSGGRVTFDGRFTFSSRNGAPDVVIAAIGTANARAVPTDAFRPAVATAPGIFQAGRLVAAPTFGARLKSWDAGAFAFQRMR
ncbi:tRNA lysidine(34) synthetase TilS [Acuticoccus kandeliae]|uniref:tRNA lysidine(34) synthetase TilS n=1 Tax=Acuticoccus kandeliae TaxID=2073160 RepID=UPI001300B5D0|nr:tRNA lysidine(34) synthetase TilS [Acuticoccus kandeliae]